MAASSQDVNFSLSLASNDEGEFLVRRSFNDLNFFDFSKRNLVSGILLKSKIFFSDKESVLKIILITEVTSVEYNII